MNIERAQIARRGGITGGVVKELINRGVEAVGLGGQRNGGGRVGISAVRAAKLCENSSSDQGLAAKPRQIPERRNREF